MVLSKAFLCACVLGAVLGLVSCRQDDAPPMQRPLSLPAAVYKPDLRALVADPVRVVWCQDRGDGSDSGTVGDQLQLIMGFDSTEGLGERALLAERSNYARPLFTHDGRRIVFSNRLTRQIHTVDWSGAGLRTVAAGYALAVWRDPESGRDWVYVGDPQSNATAYVQVRRLDLDQPDRVESVWTQTPLDGDNFQLSPDGRRAGGLLWPRCGLLDLPDRGARQYGTGCWPSLSPDGAWFWFFDGQHRNITICVPDTDMRWPVVINGAPGIDGFEVYHPRWSNRARFLIMTGPYKAGGGDNRIRAGGPAVEIHIGRFSADFRAVEAWGRVTSNAFGDFFPDLWIGGRDAAPAAASPAAMSMIRPAVSRLVMTARLAETSAIPSPVSIRPYRQALVANVYDVEKIEEGQCSAARVMAAHWAIRNERILPGAARIPGTVYRLELEPYDAHLELEGERLIMDSDAYHLPLFLSVDSPAKAGSGAP